MNAKARRVRGDNEVPKTIKEGKQVIATERDLAKGKFKCNEKGCKGKVSFGSKKILDAHTHLAHGK